MKLTLLMAAMAGLAFVPTGAFAQEYPTREPGTGAPPIIEFCDAAEPDSNARRGKCIGFFNMEERFAPCRYLADFGLLDLYGYASFGECVADTASLDDVIED